MKNSTSLLAVFLLLCTLSLTRNAFGSESCSVQIWGGKAECITVQWEVLYDTNVIPRACAKIALEGGVDEKCRVTQKNSQPWSIGYGEYVDTYRKVTLARSGATGVLEVGEPWSEVHGSQSVRPIAISVLFYLGAMTCIWIIRRLRMDIRNVYAAMMAIGVVHCLVLLSDGWLLGFTIAALLCLFMTTIAFVQSRFVSEDPALRP